MENKRLQNRIKNLRTGKKISQEELANISGLSLRTIQRIENGTNSPRGDTLKRLSVALQVSPDDIIDWQLQEDRSVLIVLNVSQLTILAFPLLGIIIPLTIWVLNKDKIKYVDSAGKSILNFQLSWTIIVFIFYLLYFISVIFHPGNTYDSIIAWLIVPLIAGLYMYNLVVIVKNTILAFKNKTGRYRPSIRFLT